jgi:excisionase family DNA binding protein
MAEDSNVPDTQNTRDFVTTSEAAEALGVSYYTVYEYIREKRLVAEMVGGIYMIPRKAVQDFKAKPTGRTRLKPPPWRVYRAGAKVRGMNIRVRVRAGQQAKLVEKLNAIREAQRYLFPGTMQRYVFEEDAEPKHVIISLIWKDTEMPDETAIQQDLAPLQAELADVLDWNTAQYSTKSAIIHT